MASFLYSPGKEKFGAPNAAIHRYKKKKKKKVFHLLLRPFLVSERQFVHAHM